MARQEEIPTTKMRFGEGDQTVDVTVATDAVARMLGTGGFRLAEGEADPRPADAESFEGRPKANGSKQAWMDYADAHDVEYGEDDSRDDIMAAVDAAGV